MRPYAGRRRLITAGLVLVAILVILGATRGPQASPIPPCLSDDGAGPTPCHWDAQTQGNGQGQSFTVYTR